jgi:outer membrane protein
MLRFLLAALIFVSADTVNAQTDNWSLQRSVAYAVEHNLSIRQSELNARLAKLTLQQSQLAQLPSANASSNYGRSYGRSVNPTTNQFENASYNFLSLSGNANVLVFGWFQQRNLISSNKYGLEASKADLDQLRDDISLNVANGFLRAVLAKEQITIFRKQVELSLAQLEQTQAFVTAGRLPEFNLAQLQSQVATDSSSLINAISNYNSALLDMKALLNLDFAVPFDIAPPEVKVDEQIALSSMDPAVIYQEAKKNFGSIKAAEMRLAAADRTVKGAKGNLYPNISFGAQLGTNWASSFQTVDGYKLNGFDPSGNYSYDSVSGNYSPVLYQPSVIPNFVNVPLGTQLDNNIRQTYSINLNIPLFNGWQAQYNVKQSKINYLRRRLDLDQSELTLKQNVYIAYNEAVNSVQKYQAAQRANDAAQRALEFATKRYELGLINTVEYLVTQNTANTSASNFASAKYDLIFKLKVIDYYLGKELKL